MLYRNLNTNQFTRILFIARPKWFNNRYVSYLRGNFNFFPKISNTNKPIYTPKISSKNNFYTSDQIGSYLTLCAALNGDLSSLKLLQSIGSKDASRSSFDTGLFKHALRSFGGVNLFEDDEFIKKIINSPGENLDFAHPFVGEVNSSVQNFVDSNFIWIPYIGFTSLGDGVDYIRGVIRSHYLTDLFDLKINQFEIPFTSSKDQIDSSFGLLCIQEEVTKPNWYDILLGYFKNSRRLTLSVVANYSVDSALSISESLKYLIIDRLWHNIRYDSIQASDSIVQLYNMKTPPADLDFWWSDLDLCIKYLLENKSKDCEMEKLGLIGMFLEKNNYRSAFLDSLTGYFNSIKSDFRYYKYDEIRDKKGYEPVVGGLNFDFSSLNDTEPPFDILNNSIKNQLFVDNSKADIVRNVSNLMYKCGISSRRIPDSGLRILTLDGGGVRVIVPLLILKMLLHEMGNPPLYEIFDLFGATSSGTLILSLLLLHKFTIDETMSLFKALFTKIFSKNKWTLMPDVLRYLASRAKFDHQILETFGRLIFGSLKMQDFNSDPRTPHVFFTSTQISPWPPRPVIFRSYPIRPNYDLSINSNLEELRFFDIWEVLRSSTAAPTYFEQFTKDGKIYSDGAILANNPTLEAINEAKMLYPGIPIRCVLSIGTGIFKLVDDSIEAQKKSGLVDLLTYATTNVDHVHRYSKMILGSDVYFRLDPLIPEISIDETSVSAMEELVGCIQEYLEDNETKKTLGKITKLLH